MKKTDENMFLSLLVCAWKLCSKEGQAVTLFTNETSHETVPIATMSIVVAPFAGTGDIYNNMIVPW